MSDGDASVDPRGMDLALAEARKGRPSPSPRAGAVVLRDASVLGVGHREHAGAPAAESIAIAAAGAHAAGATLYSTIEPADVDEIAAAGIARVVIGCRRPDPTEIVMEELRARGIEVAIGVREADAKELVADFATLTLAGRPLTVLKAATTLDGRIATRTGDSRWITSEASRAEAHALRDEADAVMVGVGTVLADDPRLDVRLVSGRDPIRIVLDTSLRTPPSAAVVTHVSGKPTWIVHGPAVDPARRRALVRDGVELLEAPLAPGGHVDLAAVLTALGRRGVMRLLVEGGARVHGALVDAGLADRAVLFVAPLVLGDRDARSLVELPHPPDTIARATRLERTRVRAIFDELRIDARFAGAPF